MKVFISWSGDTSRSVAQALREWLPCVIQAVDPWTSNQDIQTGARWSAEVARRLNETSFGILCVTPDNHQRPWLNFEAGALSKAVDEARVCPYLFSLSAADIDGPLSQFQSVVADEEGTLRLVSDLNRAIDRPLPEALLIESFERWWPKLAAMLKQIPVPQPTPSPTLTTQGVGEADVLRMLLGLMIPETEVRHLENLAAPEPYIYEKRSSFVNELRHLRSMGFIEMVGKQALGDIPQHGDAKEIVRLTPQGRSYLELRKSPGT